MKICKNCNIEFPNNIVINKKRFGLYHRKFCIGCSPFKSHNTRDITKSVISNINGKTFKICPICKRNLEMNKENYYLRDRGGYHSQCKKCGSIKTIEKQRLLKQKCIEYMGGSCHFCGYNKYFGSLHFHHLDPSKKEFGISKGRCYNFEKVKLELKKCVLACSNCHGEIHGGLLSI